jgi:hypothetical protein
MIYNMGAFIACGYGSEIVVGACTLVHVLTLGT